MQNVDYEKKKKKKREASLLTSSHVPKILDLIEDILWIHFD